MNQLAERFSVSPSQLTLRFRRYFGVSLLQYIQAQRLCRAKELIGQHPDWPLREIASAAGYLDISTMYRAFKRVDGISPGRLKAQIKGQISP